MAPAPDLRLVERGGVSFVLDLDDNVWEASSVTATTYNGRPVLKIRVERDGEKTTIYVELKP